MLREESDLRLNDIFLGGILLGFTGADLVPLNTVM
jgi:hypothetical protein